jgi:ubiquitin-protein ligase
MSNNNSRTIFVQPPSGGKFEAEIPCGTLLSKVAADFFESQGWPMQDSKGRGQRAVVELSNPIDPQETKRLNGDDDICESMVENGDTLRIFPESIAGAVDQKARMTALISDHNDMKKLIKRNQRITYKANRNHAPDQYQISMNYESFVAYHPGEPKPGIANTHSVEITLGGEYPRRAPYVIWKTPIFHPNIDPSDGEVCLGILKERYLPGLGLARIVSMLAEMVQWRNFDATNPFNREAAEWAIDPDHWHIIRSIKGHPFQGPIEQLLKMFEKDDQPPIQFKPV